ncbi:MAG: Rpn family recombination-promoting nuclease/putative transposase, partial [Emergencia sp.]|nr:Rpn family recombination-promoting nuclease/putative transposase [Emergencia sp.]
MDKKEPRIKFPFSNQTIFAMVMNDEGRCKAFLERIFPDRKVSEIKLSQNSFVEEENSARAEAEKMILNTPFHKSVRLDVLFEGDESWYDIEFQSENTDDIPKRSRYYHSMIDTHILGPGEAYAKLQPCYVIFLCRFDLFGKGKAVYQFQNYDIKNRLLLGDESYTIVLNSKAETGSIPKELEALFGYINEGEINPGRDDFIDEVHQKVLELNGDEKLMGVMTLEMD